MSELKTVIDLIKTSYLDELRLYVPGLVVLDKKLDRLRKENEELKNQPVSLLARRVDELEKRLMAVWPAWVPYPWGGRTGYLPGEGPQAGSAPVSGPEGWKDVLNWVYYTEMR